VSGEARLRREVVRLLKSLDAQPVENIVRAGTPDVEYHGGWIEVKRTKSWPARPDTPVKLEHDLTPGQRRWIRRRERVGGTVWVLVQIDRAYLLLKGGDAARWIGEANRRELIAHAHKVCLGLAELRRNLLAWVS